MEGKKVEIKNLLIAGACNTEYESFEWYKDYVAFASSNLVHLYHVPSIKTLSAIRGHKGRVNNVKFLTNGDIVSVCSQGTINLFRNPHFNDNSAKDFYQDEQKWPQWNAITTLQLGNRNILEFSLFEEPNFAIGAFLSTESDLHLIKIDYKNKTMTILDILLFGNNLLEGSTLFRFKGTHYLFVSSSDFMVHVYSLPSNFEENVEKNGKSLTFLNSLKGHEDKVKCLSSVVCKNGEEEIGLVASGSKDTYVRIWRITDALTSDISQQFIKKNIYKIGEHICHLESNLFSHSDAVSSVGWGFIGEPGNTNESNLILLTSSFDFSIQVWQREAQSKVTIV